jgi:hypothetical protein
MILIFVNEVIHSSNNDALFGPWRYFLLLSMLPVVIVIGRVTFPTSWSMLSAYSFILSSVWLLLLVNDEQSSVLHARVSSVNTSLFPAIYPSLPINLTMPISLLVRELNEAIRDCE